MNTSISRRRLLAVAAAVATLPLGVAGRAGADPARLRLPAPTGPYPVGTVPLHLLGAPGGRELMAGLWYPAGDVGRHPRAPWLAPAVLRELLVSAGFAPDAAATPLTSGHLDAPVRRAGGRLPVILYSHGAHDHRAGNTVVVQELASHGYAVVTVDHTGDAFVEFPDGRVLTPDPDLPMGPDDFAADIRFVLDRLGGKGLGGKTDFLDLRRVGMFGWSKGGTATAHLTMTDPRIRAGLSLDGPMQPAIAGTLERPFMMMTAEFTRAAEPSVAAFWEQLRGWRLNVLAEGAIHNGYGDYPGLISQLAKAIGMSDEDLRGWIGTLDPARGSRIQQAYPLAFFDRHLRGRRGRLLDGPSRAFPEVEYLR